MNNTCSRSSKHNCKKPSGYGSKPKRNENACWRKNKRGKIGSGGKRKKPNGEGKLDLAQMRELEEGEGS
jgi:hypothetical protein